MSDARQIAERIASELVNSADVYLQPNSVRAVKQRLAEAITAALEAKEREIERLRGEIKRLNDTIGHLPDDAHPDERNPRATTWLEERECWDTEVKRLRNHIFELEAKISVGGVNAHTLSGSATQKCEPLRLVRPQKLLPFLYEIVHLETAAKTKGLVYALSEREAAAKVGERFSPCNSSRVIVYPTLESANTSNVIAAECERGDLQAQLDEAKAEIARLQIQCGEWHRSAEAAMTCQDDALRQRDAYKAQLARNRVTGDTALRNQLDEAVRLLRCLLLSADAEWMEGMKGHDWRDAVREAENFLARVKGGKS